MRVAWLLHRRRSQNHYRIGRLRRRFRRRAAGLFSGRLPTAAFMIDGSAADGTPAVEDSDRFRTPIISTACNLYQFKLMKGNEDGVNRRPMGLHSAVTYGSAEIHHHA